MDKKVREYRERLSEAFIKSITENPEGWQQEWRSPVSRPVNAVSGASYRGINRMWLSYQQAAHGWEDPRWCTFKQIKDKEWHLTKGSKGTQVEYWMPYDTKEKKCITWKEYGEREDKEGISLRAKYFYVFNGCQIEGMPELELPEAQEIDEAQFIQKISQNMGVEILHDGVDSAFYRPAEDKIHLPLKEYFNDDYGYNATVLHELSHATGHESRLNRSVESGFGSAAYAYEELVAELSSCFMSENLPVQMDEHHFQNHKAYIQSWISAIEKKPETFVRAARDAEKAADYLEYQAELVSQLTYQKNIEKTMETDMKAVRENESIEGNPVRMIAEAKGNSKDYVRKYIQGFMERYDFDRPIVMQGAMIPSLMMESDLTRGGMADTKEACSAWINADPEAAFNTMIYISDKYPELEGLTAETDPGRFSLLMMEREIYKMIYEADVVDENWDKDFLFDRSAAKEICQAAGIDPPENVQQMRLWKEDGLE
ncbi:MAG: zincin-like metallopeptidase domain-containing protein [Emergencia sp.]|nr:zincin-like metallopeptidase domain-containing protein [Emergencia sp.]